VIILSVDTFLKGVNANTALAIGDK
jgi:hypothetical protein